MDQVGVSARLLVRLSRFLLLAFVLLSVVGRDQSFGERLLFRSYGVADGLTSLSGTCGALAGPGYLLVCSEHGIFSYDGRIFRNIGSNQGVVDGGIVDDLALTKDGRVTIRFPDKVFVSDHPVSLRRPPSALTFRAVDLGGARLYNDFPKQMARSGSGLALIVGRQTMHVVVPSSGAPARLEPMNYDRGERAILVDPVAVFEVRDRLWETFGDGRVCLADPGFVRCYSSVQGLTGGPWRDIAAGDGDTVLARSDDRLATIEPWTGSIRVEKLPDQGGRYDDYPQTLGLFRTPQDELVTQSANGLLIRNSSGWTRVDTRDGIPIGTITTILADRSGQLWLQLFGRGLYRGLNYGHWEGLQQDDGLSSGSAWASVRVGDSLWVSTDTGVDEVKRVDGALKVVRMVSGASYDVASGPDGTVWSGDGKHGVLVIEPTTGAVVHLATPLLNSIAITGGSRVWLGTSHGLFYVDAKPGQPLVAEPDGVPDRIVELAPDGSGGLWILMKGRLWHRLASGRLKMVAGEWPSGEFEPLALAPAKRGHIWVGGAGGLYDLTIVGDQVAKMDGVPQSDLRTNTVVAVMIDRRGWVWAGTGQGIAVTDGHRWVAADADMGLVWDDVSQGGLYADPDGSVWIATSLGMSHLLDPEWLFSTHPVHVVISQATLGGSPLPTGRFPHVDAPLSLQFGTVTFASERSTVFRYRFSGVDDGWVESTTGSVRYPSIPPGRHELVLVGYNTLNHVVSDPVILITDMAYPWWRTWWADILYVMLGAGSGYALLRFRDRASVARQRKLEGLVAESTREMRSAQAELKRQATLDSLTGLLNRGEVERRLQERLSSGQVAGETLIAMVDIDYFKQVNDSHGHLLGDELLRAIAVRVSAMLHGNDYAGRYGGEEFILVLDDHDGRGAERILMFHQVLRQNPFHLGATSIPVTCSIGLAWSGSGDDWTSLIGRADAALYKAKTSGRDKVVESQDDQVVVRLPGIGPGMSRRKADSSGD